VTNLIDLRQASSRRTVVIYLNHAERVASFFQDPQPYLSRSYNIQLRRETVREMLGDRQPASILDIGCGDGSISLPLLTQKNRLTLVDLTESMLVIARSRVPAYLAGKVSTLLGDVMRIDLAEAGFDLVLCLGVLAHVQSPADVIDRVCALVRPGGMAILTVSNGVHPVGLSRSFYSRLRDLVVKPTHPLNFLSSRTVLEQCGRRGLDLHVSFRYNFPAPGFDRVLSNDRLYRNIRRRYGSVARNTRAWLGSECIFGLIKER
jgi:2-polyprenyl-3-methyl-5-hydroxy-6-metoxy-1,4-benzoquinol methylase